MKRIHQDAAALMHKSIQDPMYYNRKTQGSHMNNFDKNNVATYHAIHVRRGDFQNHETRMTAEEIWGNCHDVFDPSASKLLYISTDERNMSFFEPFRKVYTVRFLRDYTNELHAGGKLNRNHIGMIEQIICANAHTFVGTPFSTFTGYITRMRGDYTHSLTHVL